MSNNNFFSFLTLSLSLIIIIISSSQLFSRVHAQEHVTAIQTTGIAVHYVTIEDSEYDQHTAVVTINPPLTT